MKKIFKKFWIAIKALLLLNPLSLGKENKELGERLKKEFEESSNEKTPEKNGINQKR